MPKSKTSVLAVVLWLALNCGASLHAAVDMFLDLGSDLPGESVDKAHQGQVDVLAWSWGAANSGTTRLGGGAGVGTNRFNDLTVTKWVDKSSPKLMLRCATGAHIPTATLFVRKTGTKAPIEYIKVILTDVMVTSVSTGGSGGEDRLTENISLTYAQLQIDYVPTNPDGTAGTAIPFKWDVVNTGGVTLNPVVGLTSTLTYTNGAPLARLTWASTNGVSYQVWSTTDLNAAFQPYGSPIPASSNGVNSVIVPANALRMFFRIETLSGP